MKFKLGMVCVGEKCRFIPHNMSNQRMHWSEKKKWTDAWKEQVFYNSKLAESSSDDLPFKFAKVKITLYTIRKMDKDGAYNACKPIIDGLKKDCADIILDDSPEYIDLEIVQNKVKHLKEQGVEINIL